MKLSRSDSMVHSYVLPPELVPILDDALTALGRPPGAVRLDIEDDKTP
jgi:hypothetical protein